MAATGSTNATYPSTTAIASTSAADRVTVDTVIVTPRRLAEEVVLTGELRAAESVALRAETSGRAVSLNFAEGQAVRRSQLMVKINDAELIAEKKRTSLRRDLTAQRERRLGALVAEGTISQDLYDEAASELSVLEAELELFDARIAETEVRAPFDGIVGLREISVGSYLTPQTAITTIQALDTMKLDVVAAERYAGRNPQGDRLAFSVAGIDREFEGRVLAIEPRIDAETRTVQLRAEAQNPGHVLFPGAFAKVRLVLDTQEGALMVPSGALIPGLEATVVFVVENGVAASREVRTGRRTAVDVEILGGLAAGDEVIVKDIQNVSPGTPRSHRGQGRLRVQRPRRWRQHPRRRGPTVTLYTLSIRRPVLAVVMSLVIILFGFIAFRELGVREYPSVDAPVVTVTTSYTGANADVSRSMPSSNSTTRVLRPSRLADVGRAELAPENMRTLLRRDGVPMVGVVLRPQPGANQVEIVEAFFDRVNDIARDLPPDVRLGIGFDTSTYIRQSIIEVRQTLIIALGLVVLVIFAFLRDWRTTLIPVLVIPVSLIGVFFVMYFAGFSINVLTLLGLVLAIGLVVDDAIVVLENIYTKVERDGLTPVRASIEGTREIFFAVIVTTVALVAVFMPILFLGGLAGRLFREFGVTIAGAVIISSFAALTLTPMLASRMLKRRARQPAADLSLQPLRLGHGLRRSGTGCQSRPRHRGDTGSGRS